MCNYLYVLLYLFLFFFLPVLLSAFFDEEKDMVAIEIPEAMRYSTPLIPSIIYSIANGFWRGKKPASVHRFHFQIVPPFPNRTKNPKLKLPKFQCLHGLHGPDILSAGPPLVLAETPVQGMIVSFPLPKHLDPGR